MSSISTNPFARPTVFVNLKENDGRAILKEYQSLRNRLDGMRAGEETDATIQGKTTMDARAKVETQLDQDPATEDRISLTGHATFAAPGFRGALAAAMGIDSPEADVKVTFRERDGFVNKEVRADLSGPGPLGGTNVRQVGYVLTVDDQGNIIDRH